MLYAITVYKEMGNKRKRIYAMEIRARDYVHALEQAAIRITPDRALEIRMIGDPMEGIEKARKIARQIKKKLSKEIRRVIEFDWGCPTCHIINHERREESETLFNSVCENCGSVWTHGNMTITAQIETPPIRKPARDGV